MQTQFVSVSTYRAARRECWWAAIIVRVEGGYMAFESLADYQSWRQQK